MKACYDDYPRRGRDSNTSRHRSVTKSRRALADVRSTLRIARTSREARGGDVRSDVHSAKVWSGTRSSCLMKDGWLHRPAHES